jgi:selenide,water dikinase
MPSPLPGVLVDASKGDDAGVYAIAPDLALVQTVDYFTPVVDDPYDFGRIAAVNALSDVYAMGARPITALNLAGFPQGMDPSILARILQGGADVLAEAGVALLGGHTVDDQEPKYGLAVTGVVHPDQLLRTEGARPGDVLLLTKPIGVGLATTALKRGLLTEEEVEEVTQVMLRRNDQVHVLHAFCVHAATDVTGFGLLGHLLEILRHSGVGAVVASGRVPVLRSARRLAHEDLFPTGSRRNAAYVAPYVDFHPHVPEPERALLSDAVTSGGLLLAVEAGQAQEVAQALREAGAVTADAIGHVVAGPVKVQVVP